MATSSRGDKGKAPMVEQKDIGTEEGELFDVRPPLPEPVGRSGGDKKRKKPAREEEGPLAVALLPPTAEEKRAENARKKAEKEEKYRQNSIFKHRWFVWFTQETNNQTPLEKRFFTPGSLRGIQNFRSHLMELAIVKFLEEKEKPDVRSWETSVSAMSQRLARFLEEVPKNWDKHFDVWLKSRKFEIWTEDAVRQKGEKPLLIIPGLTMRNDEEKKKWKRTAELWAQWFQPPKSIKDHACTSAKYKACESMSDNTIRFISKDNFTRRDETTRLGAGGAGRTHRVGVVDEELVPVLGAHDVVHRQTKSRADSGRDNENRPLSSLIKRSMVFVGIGDLGWAQTFEEVQKDFDPYLVSDPNPRRWIAPELHPRLAIDDEDGNKYMTKFSPESDIYALGWLIREICGDFFTDMTDEEKHEYNQAVNRRGLHIPNAAEVHGRVLKEGLEKMTWKKICHPYRNQRRTMDYWAHYFNEQLFIDPVTCARPIEYDPRAKVHPDGPQKVSKA
ncbi:hypothetical protein R1sor_001233 [Riccia sorocarpa]|uniref:Uncharacterized protein n=1 Tax=Riccia sorocarpa TaxID=122646 RepID=A0ABD3GX20_9MARC